MKKIIIPFFLSICFSTHLNGQWANDMIFARKLVDSLKNDLKSVKGPERVDCLNMLSACYYWIWDDNDKHLDSACLYANEAYNVAKKINYKRGLGYGLLHMTECASSRADNDKTKNNNEQTNLLSEKQVQEAIKIGEEIGDYRLVADGYGQLKGIEKGKGNLVKSKTYLQKQIMYYEKPVKRPLKGLLNVATCKECQGNEILLGNRYQELAGVIALENSGNLIAANNEIEKAIHYYTITGRKAAMRTMYFQIGEMVSQTADLESGINPYKKAIEVFQKSGDKKGEFDAHMRICRNYWNMGDFENGFSYCKKGVALAIELSNGKPDKENDYRLGEAYYWMSRHYLFAGDFESALYFIKKTEPFYQEGNRKVVWATAIGGVYRSMGNIDSAKYYLLPFENKSAESLGNHAGGMEPSRLYILLKEYDKAIALLTQLIKTQKQRNNNYILLGSSLTTLSKAYLGKNETSAALNAAREGRAAIYKSKQNVLLIENNEILSEIFYKMGNNDSAYIYLKLYMALKDSLLKKQYLFKLNNYKSEAEDAKRTSQIMLLQKDNLIKEQELLQQIILKQQSEAQLALLDKSNEIKDQSLKEQTLLKEQNQSQLTLSDKENKLKDERLKQQAFIRNALLSGLFLFLLLGVFIFRNLSLKRKNARLRVESLEHEMRMQQLENGKRQTELRQVTTELEMQALRAQMNPHFIFNCLSSINRFILKNETEAASDYLTRFSRLIRMVLINSQKSLITLEDELEMLRLYLDMERLRFKNSFDYNINFKNTIDAGAIYIPPLLLQPFCENAIWHGLMQKEGQGALDITMTMQNSNLNCTIADNGVGRERAAILNSKSAEKEKSLGLKITASRLELLNRNNGAQTSYKIEDLHDEKRNAAGTKVTVQIKYKDSVEEYISNLKFNNSSSRD